MVFPNATDTNVTSLLDLVVHDNAVTGNLFVPVVLLTIWAIAFIGLSAGDKTKAFFASSWLVWLLTLLLWATNLGLVAEWIVILTTLVSLGSLMFILYSGIKGPSWD